MPNPSRGQRRDPAAGRRHGRDHVRRARLRSRRQPIGVDKRIFVIDIADEDEPSDLEVFINPEITELDGSQTWKEGCLSFPGVSEEVKRAASVHVERSTSDGKPFELEADGLLAVAIQHENDHLDGV